MKKILIICLTCLFVVTGCSSEDKEEKAKTKLISNEIYGDPINPNETQTKLFNKLSKAVKDNKADSKVVELVAANFCYDFFNLRNKKSSEDIGGLAYIRDADLDNFESNARLTYYRFYNEIEKDYSKSDLPSIESHTIENVVENKVTFDDVEFDGYIVELNLVYRDSEIDTDKLKTEVAIKLVKLGDKFYVLGVE